MFLKPLVAIARQFDNEILFYCKLEVTIVQLLALKESIKFKVKQGCLDRSYHMLLDGIILKSSLQFNRNRTSSAIYHLITGKRSIQTVQDAHIYHLKKFYGITQALQKRDFDTLINSLVSKQLLNLDNSMCSSVSPKGMDWLAKHGKELNFADFDGLYYHEASAIFYERLLLLIQTLSNSCNNCSSFIPVVDKYPVLFWVKNTFRDLKSQKEDYFKRLYLEIHQLLTTFSNEEASIYVDRFSGYNHYGKSKEQLAKDFQKEKIDISLIIERMNHRLLTTISAKPETFLAIGLLVKDLKNKQFITNSAEKTYQLLEEHSINEIGKMRGLKENTVYDHIVEAALFTHDFPVVHYVSSPQQKQILAAVENDNTYKLKTIKQMVDESISYFQIRLVLATMNK